MTSYLILANGTKSKYSIVRCRVPWGTVLGPILYLILINDIEDNTDSFVSLFAHYTRIASEIISEENVEDLQTDLENCTAGKRATI